MSSQASSIFGASAARSPTAGIGSSESFQASRSLPPECVKSPQLCTGDGEPLCGPDSLCLRILADPIRNMCGDIGVRCPAGTELLCGSNCGVDSCVGRCCNCVAPDTKGTLANGQACATHLQCRSNLCGNGVCARCVNDNQCLSNICYSGVCRSQEGEKMPAVVIDLPLTPLNAQIPGDIAPEHAPVGQTGPGAIAVMAAGAAAGWAWIRRRRKR